MLTKALRTRDARRSTWPGPCGIRRAEVAEHFLIAGALVALVVSRHATGAQAAVCANGLAVRPRRSGDEPTNVDPRRLVRQPHLVAIKVARTRPADAAAVERVR